ncbi:MAG: hypothetical protein RL701_7220 [Pseudomonadota bacterium]|jgi:tRNA (guanosine-2'-O-)-methyltransferase
MAKRRDDRDNFVLPETAAMRVTPDVVLAALTPLLSEPRRARIERVIHMRSLAVAAVLDGLIDPHNVSAVLRSADAFGVQRVHLIARQEPFVAAPRIARGANQWLDVKRHASVEACVKELREHGHRIFIADVDGALRPEDLAREPKPAIVFGNEHAGVSPELRALADSTYAIPMHGFVQSLNVSVAAGITLFTAMQGRTGDLDERAVGELRARYYSLSVPQADVIIEEYLRRQSR